MKSKAPLALMEQMVMLLVFALASALCIQAFVKSDHISLRSDEKCHAALVAQDVAELLRHNGGDMEYALSHAVELSGGIYDKEKLRVNYDENWNVTEEEGTYHLTAEEVFVEESGLQKALVQVAVGEPESSELLFELEVAWLEVEPDE